MARAFRFLALLSALFVVVLRFGSALPMAAVCTEVLNSTVSAEPCIRSDAPEHREQLAVAAVDDTADDVGDPLLSPSSGEVELRAFGAASCASRGVLAADPARTSHGSGLDRPPRV